MLTPLDTAAVTRGRELAAAAAITIDQLQARRAAALVRAKAAQRTLALDDDAESAGLLICEGDSWFDYPGTDVPRELRNEFGYDIEVAAHRGDLVEDMAYNSDQVEGVQELMRKARDRGEIPKAILLSGGGNDMVGGVFSLVVNDKRSPIAGMNSEVIAGVIDTRLRTAYVTLFTSLSESCLKYFGKIVPIVIHGYDYPVPDGRGYEWGPFTFSGPWIKPGFTTKAYGDLPERIPLVGQLIKRFNEMLDALASTAPFNSYVHYLDLRGTLSTDLTTYRNWWDNELHPTRQGFTLVAKKYDELLRKIP